MTRNGVEHSLEFLLSFDGQIYRYADGYWVKFEVAREAESEHRPHGLRYSLTLHGPDNRRLVGFDKAHSVDAGGSRFTRRSKAMDHRHRTETDEGRPYRYIDVDTLIDDFFDEVERVLNERGIPLGVVEMLNGDNR